MASCQLVVLFDQIISLVSSRSVGYHPRPGGGGRGASVTKEIDGESDDSLKGNRFLVWFMSVRCDINIGIITFW